MMLFADPVWISVRDRCRVLLLNLWKYSRASHLMPALASINPEPHETLAQGQLATYKEVAAGAEAERARLEAEVVATAQLVTAVESRLRGALQAKDAAEARVGAAEMRVREVRGLFRP